MEHPHAGQNPAGEIQPLEEHQGKAEGHQQGDGGHHPPFGAHGHGPVGDVALQVVLVELGVDKPGVQPLGAFGKAEGRQQQKGEGRQQGQHRPHGSQSHADAAQYNPQNTLHLRFLSNLFCSRFVSITWRIAVPGWTKSILGPAKAMTWRIFSRISGL